MGWGRTTSGMGWGRTTSGVRVEPRGRCSEIEGRKPITTVHKAITSGHRK